MDDVLKGIVGLITLIAVFGGGMYLSQDQLDSAYYCTATGEFGIFYGGISSTGITAYPFAENRTQPTYCLTSQGTKISWVRLTDYAKEIGIDPLELIQQKPSEVPIGIWGKQYICNQEGCTEK